MPTELEVKYELPDRSSFDRLHQQLVELAGEPKVLNQLNIYFDSEDRTLANCLSIFRIRMTDQAIITYKVGREIKPGQFKSEEYEEVIDFNSVENLIQNPKELFSIDSPVIAELKKNHSSLELVVLGKLKNRRHVFELEGYQLELDLMQFEENHEEYELEVESSNMAEASKWCEDLLTKYRFEIQPSRLTKLHRFLRWLNQI